MLIGFLNYKGLGGEFIALCDESKPVSSFPTHRFFKIESVLFIPLMPFNVDDDRILKRLEAFQKLMQNFGYYSIGESATSRVIDDGSFI